MTRAELTEILLRFMADDINVKDPKVFLESLEDKNFEDFARGYLLGISIRLKSYEQNFAIYERMLGVKLSES
jgi:hypothetical protein